MNGPAQPWDHQPGESAQAYEAFRIYRDAGPGRSTAATARALAKSKSLIQRWCSQWSWTDRAAAWDAAALPELDAIVAERQRLAVRQRLDAADTMRSKAIAAIAALDPEEIGATAAVRLLEAAERLEAETLARYVPSAEKDRQQAGDASLDDILAELDATWHPTGR